MSIRFTNRQHHGIVFGSANEALAMNSASMGSIFSIGSDSKLYLFYTVAPRSDWSKSTIGLATSSDGINFRENSHDPIIEVGTGSSGQAQTLNPAVVRLKNKFYMVLSGKHSPDSYRNIAIAYADDPEGPWHVIGELIKPTHFWEGNAIDNGCSLAKLDDESFLVYYSSLTAPKLYDVFTFLRRYPIRRIGILKVRVHGTTRSSIEAMHFSGNPLSHLNGSKGSWNESVFCPGYLRTDDTHFMFPAASTYSIGFPYKQYIGLARSNSSYFVKEGLYVEKLIDGPLEKTQIIRGIKGEIALDTASPYLNSEKSKLYLYYSVADRADETWKIALTTFDLRGD